MAVRVYACVLTFGLFFCGWGDGRFKRARGNACIINNGAHDADDWVAPTPEPESTFNARESQSTLRADIVIQL